MTHQLRIKPRLDYQLLGATSHLLHTRTYSARYASNQPNWEREGKIFVKDMLLVRGEYKIIAILQSVHAYKRSLLQEH